MFETNVREYCLDRLSKYWPRASTKITQHENNRNFLYHSLTKSYFQTHQLSIQTYHYYHYFHARFLPTSIRTTFYDMHRTTASKWLLWRNLFTIIMNGLVSAPRICVQCVAVNCEIVLFYILCESTASINTGGVKYSVHSSVPDSKESSLVLWNRALKFLSKSFWYSVLQKRNFSMRFNVS